MKKYTLLQTILLAVVALIAGFFLGTSIGSFTPSGEDIAGSIGKVNRYRNVKVTENDILLRNEMVSDKNKREQYQRYLTYYYYQSLRNLSDLDQVLTKTATVTEFATFNEPFLTPLANFKVYLEKAHSDIFVALNMVGSLTEDEDVPLIQYLNQAQNTIARIRNNDAMLMSYMETMATFMEANPDKKYDALEDAHDILVNNLLTSAVMSQNKPVLKYLDQKKLKNDKEGIKELVAEANLNSFLNDQFNMDVANLGAMNSRLLDAGTIGNVEQLNFLLCNIDNLGSSELGNQAVLNSILLNAENLGVVYDAQQIGSVILLNVEGMGSATDQ